MPDPRPGGTDLRRAILDESRHLLVSDGYDNLSMRKIARAVGCSATSIYLHFELHPEALEADVAAGEFVVEGPDTGAHVLRTALHGLFSLLLAERVDVKAADDAFVDASIRHAVDGFRV